MSDKLRKQFEDEEIDAQTLPPWSKNDLYMIWLEEKILSILDNNEREAKVQELCKQIDKVEIGLIVYDAINGDKNFYCYCPFCRTRLYDYMINHTEDIASQIKHDKDCAYLIAKELYRGDDKKDE